MHISKLALNQARSNDAHAIDWTARDQDLRSRLVLLSLYRELEDLPLFVQEARKDRSLGKAIVLDWNEVTVVLKEDGLKGKSRETPPDIG